MVAGEAVLRADRSDVGSNDFPTRRRLTRFAGSEASPRSKRASRRPAAPKVRQRQSWSCKNPIIGKG